MKLTSIIIKKLGLLLIPAFCFFAANAQQQDSIALNEIKIHHDKQQAKFIDPAKSPLDKKQLKNFTGLKYFAPDLKYRVSARFIKNETPVLFKMKTTTSQLTQYEKYGEVHFEIERQQYVLEVYRSPEINKMPGYEDYLFIPFTDKTSGYESYDVGRYIDITVPITDTVIIDFNQCYNPYCSYSDRYSCPIPPKVNNLPIAIPAGEKKFSDHH